MMIDNSELFEIYDRERERKLQKLPTCERCGEPIQQFDAVRWRGMWFCDSCLEEMREDTMSDCY
ncbi:MAG: hypothetical protein IKH75_10290 [Ruminococcus sp.]|nr:hypothetical protein [Ruminococcus sp.]